MTVAGIHMDIVRATQEHKNFILSSMQRSLVSRQRKTYVTSPPSHGTLSCKDSIVPMTAALYDKYVPAVLTTDGYTVHAWALVDEGKLIYVYVAPHIRGIGVSKVLTEKLCGPKFRYAFPWPFAKPPSGGTYDMFLVGEK